MFDPIAFRRLAVVLPLLAGLGAERGDAATVSFNALVINLCVLTLTTPGVLAASADGTSLASDNGGVKATMSVIATGTHPTISFTAPNSTGPAGWTGNPTRFLAYSSLLGANQPYTSGASQVAMTGLLDTFTIDGKIVNASGFASGSYTLTSTATCQQ